jgi:radical SAM protein with 4Fe4S-binding SPASM domain
LNEIIECVPNFSTSDPKVVEAILAEIRKNKDAYLLDYSYDDFYNRLVVSFVGSKNSVVKAALDSAVKAVRLIDMKKHKGQHPRIGAVDVVPFIPIENVTLEDCVGLARNFGKALAERTKVPVYLYANAASKPERSDLDWIRIGNYEKLKEMMTKPLQARVSTEDYNKVVNAINQKQSTHEEMIEIAEEREKLMLYLLDRMSKGYKVTILTTAPQLARVALQCQGAGDEATMSMAHMQTVKVSKKAVPLADFIGGCGAGRFYCAVSPEGKVQPCVFLPINVGNLKSEKFGDVWLTSSLFNELRDRGNLKGACGKCNYKYTCGGCRARAKLIRITFRAPIQGACWLERRRVLSSAAEDCFNSKGKLGFR